MLALQYLGLQQHILDIRQQFSRLAIGHLWCSEHRILREIRVYGTITIQSILDYIIFFFQNNREFQIKILHEVEV